MTEVIAYAVFNGFGQLLSAWPDLYEARAAAASYETEYKFDATIKVVTLEERDDD
ncbi:MAG TPA: hypothetical protein VIV60_24910 [Polyangiaceae bacterium]